MSGIGPVFTPGRVAAGTGTRAPPSAAVAQRLLDQGARVCLFTDQANPTSNRIYERLGFRPVTDTANLVIRHGQAQPGRP